MNADSCASVLTDKHSLGISIISESYYQHHCMMCITFSFGTHLVLLTVSTDIHLFFYGTLWHAFSVWNLKLGYAQEVVVVESWRKCHHEGQKKPWLTRNDNTNEDASSRFSMQKHQSGFHQWTSKPTMAMLPCLDHLHWPQNTLVLLMRSSPMPLWCFSDNYIKLQLAEEC